MNSDYTYLGELYCYMVLFYRGKTLMFHKDINNHRKSSSFCNQTLSADAYINRTTRHYQKIKQEKVHEIH